MNYPYQNYHYTNNDERFFPFLLGPILLGGLGGYALGTAASRPRPFYGVTYPAPYNPYPYAKPYNPISYYGGYHYY